MTNRQSENPMVLLVDDNDVFRGAARDLLTEMGCDVTEASRGREALTVAEASEVDVLVSDFAMPGMNGVELVERMLGRRQDLPVVLMSSSEDLELVRRVARGDVAFLAKPFSVEQLAAALGEARDRRELRRAEPARRDPVLPSHNRAQRSILSLLAAAALATGVAATLWIGGPAAPPLPDPEPTTVRRSAHVEPVAPLGEMTALPPELRFFGARGAVSYRLRLEGVDGELLWKKTIETVLLERNSTVSAELPLRLRRTLHPAVSYYWRVEAFDAEGRRIAFSAPTRFRVNPLGQRP